MAPRVSVVIPTYNRAGLLPAAIASLQAQSMADLEVIVVDDGSTDNTAAAVQPFLADSRVRYVIQVNQGRSAARNYGAHLAQADFLGFLDSDDRQLPGALEAHLGALAQSPGCALLIGGYEYVDQNGRTIGQRLPWTEASDLGLCQWVFNCFGVHGAFLLRKDWFARIQGYDTRLHMAEDWDLFLRLALAGCPMGWTQAVVCQYRQHSGSSIHDQEQHRESSLRALGKVFQGSGPAAPCADLRARAEAWVYVVFARRAFAAGFSENGRGDLQRALDLDPGLAGERRLHLLEALLSPEVLGQLAGADMEAAVLPFLPAVLKDHAADTRRARARVHMAAFFRAQGQPVPDQARAHLRAALQLDARWLLNRGVLAFCARQFFRRAPLGVRS